MSDRPLKIQWICQRENGQNLKLVTWLRYPDVTDAKGEDHHNNEQYAQTDQHTKSATQFAFSFKEQLIVGWQPRWLLGIRGALHDLACATAPTKHLVCLFFCQIVVEVW